LSSPAACRACGCTQNDPCVLKPDTGEKYSAEFLEGLDDDGLDELDATVCSWVESDLCSACVESPAPAPLLFDALGRPLRGAP